MLTIFATGGTFDKIYFDANSQFSVGEPQAEPLLKEANLDIDYHVQSLLAKDSQDMTEEDLAAIGKAVAESNNDHIVITHGTDGMVATATALAKQGIQSKTIVFVGAMQPARMRYSDAPFNLGFAVAAVQLLPAGVYIAMNGRVFPHDQVVKNLDAGKFERLN
ncbi:MAG: asparaginase domain-containing protein [Pseudomonadota bacterium]